MSGTTCELSGLRNLYTTCLADLTLDGVLWELSLIGFNGGVSAKLSSYTNTTINVELYGTYTVVDGVVTVQLVTGTYENRREIGQAVPLAEGFAQTFNLNSYEAVLKSNDFMGAVADAVSGTVLSETESYLAWANHANSNYAITPPF